MRTLGPLPTGRPAISLTRNDVAVGRGNKYFVGGVEIVDKKCPFRDGHSGRRSDFEHHASSNACEAAGRERRGENHAVAGAENIGRRAFGNLAALVQQHHLIETSLLRLIEIPHIVEPGSYFHACQRRCGVTAVLAQPQADNVAMSRQGRRTDQQVGLGKGFVAAPETELIVDGINSRATLPNLVGLRELRPSRREPLLPQTEAGNAFFPNRAGGAASGAQRQRVCPRQFEWW